jgi:hypothetical protein
VRSSFGKCSNDCHKEGKTLIDQLSNSTEKIIEFDCCSTDGCNKLE